MKKGGGGGVGGGRGGALLKIGTNQNWRIGGKKGEADASSQIVTHLFVFFCYVAEYLST